MTKPNIAAIDLGTNSFHLVIVKLRQDEFSRQKYEIESKSQFEILYRQREVVRLNRFLSTSSNLLENENVQYALRILEDFKRKADDFDAEVFAVATSAIREADFREEFVLMVKEKLGFNVKVVSGFEEAKLIYLGVLQGLDVFNKQILLIDIGGGSTEFLIGRRGKILYTASLKLGAVRLTQEFFHFKDSFDELSKKECDEFIQKQLDSIIKPIKKVGFDEVIGTAGTLSSIARTIHQIANENKTIHGKIINQNEVNNLTSKIISSNNIEELRKIKNIDESRLDIILAGSMIIKRIFDKLNLYEMTLSTYALREGIIIDAIEKIFLKNSLTYSFSLDEKLISNNRIKSVIELAQFYDSDLDHSFHVRKLSLLIFDELKSIHKLDNYARDLLDYASILHDIGYNISPQNHHKHSYNLIIHSNLVGFTEKELKLIANIARYHRKALPKKQNKHLAEFNDYEFNLVQTLSAILRLADGLEKTHSALIKDIKVFPTSSKKNFKLLLRYLTNPPEMELWTANKRKSALEKALKVKFELNLEKISI